MMGATDRPTLTPPFDPEAFARESESKLRISAPARPPDLGSGVMVRRPPTKPLAREDNSFDDFDDFDRITTQVPAEPIAAITRATVPTLSMPPDRIRDAQLDHRAGFILSHVDGISDVETILDVSGMPEADVMRILRDLATKGIIRTS